MRSDPTTFRLDATDFAVMLCPAQRLNAQQAASLRHEGRLTESRRMRHRNADTYVHTETPPVGNPKARYS